MRKRNFYSIIALVATIFLLVMFRPWVSPDAAPKGKNLYASNAYKITLLYPSNWKPEAAYATDRFSGTDGFFEVSAEGSDGSLDLEDVANIETSHVLSPYGKDPKVQTIKAGGKQASLILPSEDQDPSMRGQAALVVAYPEPILINNTLYFYLVIWADKEHIKEIADTLVFQDESNR
jgi:TolB protein